MTPPVFLIGRVKGNRIDLFLQPRQGLGQMLDRTQRHDGDAIGGFRGRRRARSGRKRAVNRRSMNRVASGLRCNKRSTVERGRRTRSLSWRVTTVAERGASETSAISPTSWPTLIFATILRLGSRPTKMPSCPDVRRKASRRRIALLEQDRAGGDAEPFERSLRLRGSAWVRDPRPASAPRGSVATTRRSIAARHPVPPEVAPGADGSMAASADEAQRNPPRISRPEKVRYGIPRSRPNAHIVDLTNGRGVWRAVATASIAVRISG